MLAGVHRGPGGGDTAQDSFVAALDGSSGAVRGRYPGAPRPPLVVSVVQDGGGGAPSVVALGGAREVTEWDGTGKRRASIRLGSPPRPPGGAGAPAPRVAARAPAGGPPWGADAFVPSLGFRGGRAGYTFRDGGPMGPGYYRAPGVPAAGGPAPSPAAGRGAAAGAPPACRAAVVLARDPRGRPARVAFGSLDAGDDCSATVWDLPGGAPVSTLAGHGAPVTALAASADGSLVASGSHDRTVRVWDAAAGEQLASFLAHRAGVRAVAVLPGAERVVSAGADNAVREWDLGLGLSRRALEGQHAAPSFPVCLSVSPDGATLATGSNGPLVESSVLVRSGPPGPPPPGLRRAAPPPGTRGEPRRPAPRPQPPPPPPPPAGTCARAGACASSGTSRRAQGARCRASASPAPPAPAPRARPPSPSS